MRVGLSAAFLIALALAGAAVASWRDMDPATASAGLVLLVGIGGWFMVAAPLLRHWREAGDPMRQARLVEAFRPELRGRLVASVYRQAGGHPGESDAIVTLMARRALTKVDGLPLEAIHTARSERQTGSVAALAWLCLMVIGATIPGGTHGVADWWFGGGGAQAAMASATTEAGLEPAKVGDLTLRYLYPDYTGLDPYVVENSTGEAHAPPGTLVEVVARSGEPVSSAALVAYDEPAVDARVTDERTISGSFMVQADVGAYTLLTYSDGKSQASRAFPIVPEPDLPPEVTLGDGRDVIEVAINGSFEMPWTARDDYGVQRVALELDGREITPDLRRAREREAEVADRLTKRPVDLGMQSGKTYELSVVAWDNDTFSGTKSGRSNMVKVVVLGPDGARELTAERREELLSILIDILGDHLEEPYPPGPSSGDYARWGETLSNRYTPLMAFLEEYTAGRRRLRGMEWAMVQLAVDAARDLIRYTQVSFLPNATTFAPAASLELVDGFRDDAILTTEEAALAVDRMIRANAYAEFSEYAEKLAWSAADIRAELANEEVAPFALLSELDSLDADLAKLEQAAQKLPTGGIADYVLSRTAESRMMTDEVRGAIGRTEMEEARELMERMAQRLDEMARGIRDELERRLEEGGKQKQKADQLKEELKAIADAQEKMAEQVAEIREKGDARLQEELAGRWKAVEEQTAKLDAAIQGVRDGLEEAGRAFNEKELAGYAAEEADGVEDAVAARDFSGAEMSADGVDRAWRMYERRFQQLHRKAAPQGPGQADLLRVRGEVEELFKRLEELRLLEGRGDPSVRRQVQQFTAAQRSLELRLEKASVDAERLSQEFPVTPRGMMEALEQADQRMGDAGTQLERGQAMQAQGSQSAAAAHVREALDALEQAKQQQQQQDREMQKQSGNNPEESGEEQQEGDDQSPSSDQFELPEPEEFRTPEAYRRALLLGMEGDVPEEFRALKKRYYEELVHQ